MELITQMAENQKIQETRLDELKNSVGKLQEDLEAARAGKIAAECLLKEAQDELKQINERYNQLLEESKTAKDLYTRELNLAHKHCNAVDLELKTTYEELISEMRILENKNQLLEDELKETREKLSLSTQKERYMEEETDNLKALVKEKSEILAALQVENENNSSQLHSCKLQLVKERNINGRLMDEVKRAKKDIEMKTQQLEETKSDREGMKMQIEEHAQLAAKNRLLEIEVRELKTLTITVIKGNETLDQKISMIGTLLKGETVTVGVQTDMTNYDLDQYESLDKQATLMVMSLKEQMLNMKQQFLESRHENDLLKGFVQDLKRDKEEKEEGERVGRLEEAVRNLSEMVREELCYQPPTRDANILQALQDVKSDLNLLKSRRNCKNRQHDRGDSLVTPVNLAQPFDPSNRPVKLVTFRNLRPKD